MKIKRLILWLILALLESLTVLSIFGAFMGAEKATHFFNSIPLIVYWSFASLLFVVGIAVFSRLRNKPGLFAIHTGCLLVLLGSLWASPAGHEIAAKMFGKEKIDEGHMAIFEGEQENRVLDGNFEQVLGQLPFSIRLDDFRLEYYESDEVRIPQLFIRNTQGQVFQIAAVPGNEFQFDIGKLTIINNYRKFRLKFEDGKRVAYDTDQGEDNPAVEVRIDLNNGESYSRYSFEKYTGMGMGSEKDGLELRYITEMPGMVRDYFSDLTIIEDGKETLTKTIEVNHPLHYKGYHFYQDSYDKQNERYTILAVTSDSGLYMVYAGYILLCAGVIWQLWIIPATKYFNTNKKASA